MHETLIGKSSSFLTKAKQNRWIQGCVQKNISLKVTKGIYSGGRAKKAARHEYDVSDLDKARASRAM